jgi:hypothetical protein
MKSVLAPVFSIIVCLTMPACAIGQNPATPPPGQSTGRQYGEGPSDIKGFNEYENFRGMVNSFGSLLKLDSTLGYDFNQHVGVFAGVPLYFASDSSGTPGQTRIRDAGAGEITALRSRFPRLRGAWAKASARGSRQSIGIIASAIALAALRHSWRQDWEILFLILSW